VRPHLEYAQEVWSPQWKREKDTLEKVQRRATKMVNSIRHLPYEDRLRALHLPTLEHRRLRGDLITMHKITRGHMTTSMEIPYSETTNLRGHQFKLSEIRAHHQLRSKLDTNRVVKPWNSLPASVVSVNSTNAFKNALDNYWRKSNHNIYSYRW